MYNAVLKWGIYVYVVAERSHVLRLVCTAFLRTVLASELTGFSGHCEIPCDVPRYEYQQRRGVEEELGE